MDLSDLGEFGLIGRIRSTFSKTSARAPIGIGDDAAALSLSPSATLLATTDMLLEGVHFDLSTTDLYSLGWKSAAANLSDIAAMGGRPRFCLVGLGIPRTFPVRRITDLYRGLRALLDEHDTLLVGGDTCRSDSGFVISVTLLGEAPQKRIITRSHARPGDRIFVTGTLGGSAAGLELLTAEAGSRRRSARTLIERHLRPSPRVLWGLKLAKAGCVTSMIDVSDGLSSDLGHLCEESGVGAEVHADRVPIAQELRAQNGLRRAALDYALSGGEDYELLFTVPAGKVPKLRNLRIPVTQIGEVVTGSRAVLISADGSARPLGATGYDHFGSRRQARGARR